MDKPEASQPQTGKRFQKPVHMLWQRGFSQLNCDRAGGDCKLMRQITYLFDHVQLLDDRGIHIDREVCNQSRPTAIR